MNGLLYISAAHGISFAAACGLALGWGLILLGVHLGETVKNGKGPGYLLSRRGRAGGWQRVAWGR